MDQKVMVSVSRSLEVSISHPETGQIKFGLNRVSAQHLAATLREYAGMPSKSMALNSRVFGAVLGELIRPRATRSGSIRVAVRKTGTVWL